MSRLLSCRPSSCYFQAFFRYSTVAFSRRLSEKLTTVSDKDYVNYSIVKSLVESLISKNIKLRLEDSNKLLLLNGSVSTAPSSLDKEEMFFNLWNYYLENGLCQENTSLFNSYIKVCTQNGLDIEWENLMDKMSRSGAAPNKGTYLQILKHFTSKGSMENASRLLPFLLDKDNTLPDEALLALACGYINAGKLEDCDYVLKFLQEEGMNNRKFPLWQLEKLAKAYARNGYLEKVLEIFLNMDGGILPMKLWLKTYVEFSAAGKSDLALKFIDFIPSSWFSNKSNPYVLTAQLQLLSMHSKESFYHLYNKMSQDAQKQSARKLLLTMISYNYDVDEVAQFTIDNKYTKKDLLSFLSYLNVLSDYGAKIFQSFITKTGESFRSDEIGIFLIQPAFSDTGAIELVNFAAEYSEMNDHFLAKYAFPHLVTYWGRKIPNLYPSFKNTFDASTFKFNHILYYLVNPYRNLDAALYALRTYSKADEKLDFPRKYLQILSKRILPAKSAEFYCSASLLVLLHEMFPDYSLSLYIDLLTSKPDLLPAFANYLYKKYPYPLFSPKIFEVGHNFASKKGFKFSKRAVISLEALCGVTSAQSERTPAERIELVSENERLEIIRSEIKKGKNQFAMTFVDALINMENDKRGSPSVEDLLKTAKVMSEHEVTRVKVLSLLESCLPQTNLVTQGSGALSKDFMDILSVLTEQSGVDAHSLYSVSNEMAKKLGLFLYKQEWVTPITKILLNEIDAKYLNEWLVRVIYYQKGLSPEVLDLFKGDSFPVLLNFLKLLKTAYESNANRTDRTSNFLTTSKAIVSSLVDSSREEDVKQVLSIMSGNLRQEFLFQINQLVPFEKLCEYVSVEDKSRNLDSALKNANDHRATSLTSALLLSKTGRAHNVDRAVFNNLIYVANLIRTTLPLSVSLMAIDKYLGRSSPFTQALERGTLTRHSLQKVLQTPRDSLSETFWHAVHRAFTGSNSTARYELFTGALLEAGRIDLMMDLLSTCPGLARSRLLQPLLIWPKLQEHPELHAAVMDSGRLSLTDMALHLPWERSAMLARCCDSMDMAAAVEAAEWARQGGWPDMLKCLDTVSEKSGPELLTNVLRKLGMLLAYSSKSREEMEKPLDKVRKHFPVDSGAASALADSMQMHCYTTGKQCPEMEKSELSPISLVAAGHATPFDELLKISGTAKGALHKQMGLWKWRRPVLINWLRENCDPLSESDCAQFAMLTLATFIDKRETLPSFVNGLLHDFMAIGDTKFLQAMRPFAISSAGTFISTAHVDNMILAALGRLSPLTESVTFTNRSLYGLMMHRQEHFMKLQQAAEQAEIDQHPVVRLLASVAVGPVPYVPTPVKYVASLAKDDTFQLVDAAMQVIRSERNLSPAVKNNIKKLKSLGTTPNSQDLLSKKIEHHLRM